MQPTCPFPLRLERSTSLPSLEQLALPTPNIRLDAMNTKGGAPMPSLLSHPPGFQLPDADRRHTLPPIKQGRRDHSLTPSPPLIHRRLSFSSSASSSAPYSRPTTPLFQPYPSPSPAPSQYHQQLQQQQQQAYYAQAYQKQPQLQHQHAHFKCPQCPQVYRKIGHLNRHALTHQGTRFSCQVRFSLSLLQSSARY